MNNFKRCMHGSVLLITFVVTMCIFAASCNSKPVRYTVSIECDDNTAIPCNVELALTPAERTRGFMERTHIPPGTGMLFVFPTDQRLSFWMKNTPVALSIAYIDSSGTIRDIFDMRPFSTDSVSARTSVRYALEVPAGWFDANNIKSGCRLVLPESLHNTVSAVRE